MQPYLFYLLGAAFGRGGFKLSLIIARPDSQACRVEPGLHLGRLQLTSYRKG